MTAGSRAAARHLLGAGKGAVADGVGSLCACCGQSPYPAGRAASKVMGPLFTDHDLMFDPSIPDVCEGCAKMLGGKPSKTDPPLRMKHFAAVGSELRLPTIDELAEWLREPPPALRVVGWTASRQKHASLHARLSTPPVVHVATESGSVEWLPEHVPLLDAVEALRRHCRREQILSGQYPPHAIAKMGAEWERCERIVREHRETLRLEMVVGIIRKPTTDTEEPEPMPIATEQRAAAELLLQLVKWSAERRADPIRFWAELLPRRLAAASSRPTLLAAMADLMERIQSEPVGTAPALEAVESMTDEDAAAVLHTWRTQPRLVLAATRLIRDED